MGRVSSLPDYMKVVIGLTIINLIILGTRNLIVGNVFFDFLRSNLFIGSFPVIILAFVIDIFQKRLHPFWFWAITAVWVLFYPNAPYMISDLIHNSADPLDPADKQLIIFDTLIIFSIAMLSVFYGFLSLKIMFRVFEERYSRKFANWAININLLLSSLGFYMGRELLSAIKLGNGYMYSWEIFLEPLKIIKTVWNALWPIGEHGAAYALIFLFWILQYLLLIIFKHVGDVKTSNL